MGISFDQSYASNSDEKIFLYRITWQAFHAEEEIKLVWARNEVEATAEIDSDLYCVVIKVERLLIN